jgi:hypothetical protein
MTLSCHKLQLKNVNFMLLQKYKLNIHFSVKKKVIKTYIQQVSAGNFSQQNYDNVSGSSSLFPSVINSYS